MRAEQAIQRVCKWRSVLAGWQLGTRSEADPEGQAVRDQREALIMLRIEVSALVRLMLDNGVISKKALEMQVGDEARALDEAYRRRFPGFESTDWGMAIVDIEAAQRTMMGWPP